MWAARPSNSMNPQSTVQLTAQHGPGSQFSFQTRSPQGKEETICYLSLLVERVDSFMLQQHLPCNFLHISRATQFRWIQKEGTGERQSWGVDHVYIGEACPGLCSGHGYCTSGVICICDEGHHGGLQTVYYIRCIAIYYL